MRGTYEGLILSIGPVSICRVNNLEATIFALIFPQKPRLVSYLTRSRPRPLQPIGTLTLGT
ncbi:hypothetical protein BGZ63DRAFT_385315 [Mariannaea sp. PMI_226]|nr:hypothetical protein BGZ63DRAFT_385315 [Mariannaea sp. PMI_226]